MSSYEIINLLFGQGMKVLELMKSWELFNIEAIRCNDIRLALQQMLRLNACDLWDCRESVGKVGWTSLHAVPMVDTSPPSFLIYIKLKENHICKFCYERKVLNLSTSMCAPFQLVLLYEKPVKKKIIV